MKKGIILVMAALVVACGQNKKSDDKLIRGTGGRGATGFSAPTNMPANATQAINTGIWGILSPQSNQSSRDFLSTDWPENIVGATTQQPDQQWRPADGLTPQPCRTGICEARVAFGVESAAQHVPLSTSSNQSISQIISSNQRVNITEGGITLGFWDNLVGTTMIDIDTGAQETLTAIPVYIPIVAQSSFIQGANINMTFQDSKGTVLVTGQVNNTTGMINGQISYQNRVDYNNNPSVKAGTLGTMQIHVCSMFRCQ